jgi:hypothetical protein
VADIAQFPKAVEPEATTAVAALTPDQAAHFWPTIGPLLAPLIDDEGLYRPTDILVQCIRGHALAWVAVRNHDIIAAMITRIEAYPRKQVVVVPYIAGTGMRSWAALFLRELEAYAMAKGCTRLAGGMRRGWARVADFKEMGVVLWKDLPCAENHDG